jgi:putative tricarboxylic transport membrane protein
MERFARPGCRGGRHAVRGGSTEAVNMHWKKYVDLYIGLFFLAFTVIYITQIPAIRITRVSLVNSAAYPKAMAAMLLFLTAAQLYVALKQLKQGVQVEAEPSKKEYRGVAQTLFLVVAYVLALEPLGFPISSCAYIFLQILIMCPPAKVRPAQFAVIAVVASSIIYVVFRYGLDLMLPLGFLEILLY